MLMLSGFLLVSVVDDYLCRRANHGKSAPCVTGAPPFSSCSPLSIYFLIFCCFFYFFSFLPCCMECRRGLAIRFLSVRLSVRLSVCQTRALWQNGRKICPDFYTLRKIIQSSFMTRRMVGGGRPLLSEILGQPARVGAKSPILNQ